MVDKTGPADKRVGKLANHVIFLEGKIRFKTENFDLLLTVKIHKHKF